MAKGRRRPASAIEEDQSPALSANSKATAAATGGDGGVSKSLETSTPTTATTSNNEVKFGKHLASSDKRVRDRTVAALREWLRQRSKGGALTDLDLLKIWRGLWYCMFMCDKAPVQRELAENLAGLLSLFKDDRWEGVRFFRSFCVTMQRDWERIDNLRIDKYYTLVRVFVREALAFCRVPAAPVASPTPSKKKKKGKKNSPAAAATDQDEGAAAAAAAEQNGGGGAAAAEWDLALVGGMSNVMEDEVLTLHPAPIGLRLHLADVWAEEACNAGGEDMPTEAFLVALAPWLRAAAHPATNAVVFRRTFEGVLEGLLDYFPEEEEGDGMMTEEGDEEEKKAFKTVELDQVQACLFEVAAAPQTRQKRRAKLYELHRRYQKRTGVAPDASAPPSGILPLPEDSESDSDDDDGSEREDGGADGEYVEAGARPRAVRGPEPPVAGWAAAGIAAGAISRGDDDGGGGHGARGESGAVEAEVVGAESVGGKVKKRRKRSGSVEGEEAGTGGEEGGRAKRSKKKRKSEGGGDAESREAGEGEEAVEEEGVAEGSAKKKGKKKKRASLEKEGASEAAAATEVGAADTPSKKGSKKRKKREASLDDDEAIAEGGEATLNGDDAQSSPPSSVKRKNKKKRRGSTDGGAGGTPLEAAATPVAEAAVPAAAAAEVPTPPSSGKKKKKKKSKAGAEEEAVTPDAPVGVAAAREEAVTPDSSAEKKKKKKKKRSSLEGGAESPTSPAGTASSAYSEVPEPSSESFHTPPKAGGKQGGGGSSGKKKKKKSPGAPESARKTVTFGVDMEKDHVTSVKDLKTRVITPSKDSGTPQKGLLKVGGGGSGVKLMKPTAQRKDTPYLNKKKKASDFF